MKLRLTALSLLVAALVSAQPATRRAANIEALLAYPGFYHQRPVVLVGQVSRRDNGDLRVGGDGDGLLIVFKGTAPEGLDEVRGELWDIGRMHQDDAHLAGYDLKSTFHVDPDAPWPQPGKVFAFVASAVNPATPPPAPSVRNIVLFPGRYLDQRVTVTGQFEGRNLVGDLPDAPARSKYDFVLKATDAAIWVTNIRPHGKDFDLSLDARIDTGRWLEVTGTIHQGRGLQWLDAEAGTLKLAKAPVEKPIEEPIRVAPAPPPEVVFSAPTAGETDVASTTNVRVQFSRDIDQATLRGRVRASYEQDSTQPALTTKYNAGNRVLEITFPRPLLTFRTVRIDLLEGILGTDKQPLAPWTLTFETGK